MPTSLRALQPVRSTGDGAERGGDDVLVHADAEERPPVAGARLDIGDGRRIGAGAHGMLMVVDHLDLDGEGARQRIDEGVDGSRAMALDATGLALDPDRGLERPALGAVGQRGMVDEAIGAGLVEKFRLEGLPDLARAQLLAVAIGDGLHHLAELDLEAARQEKPVVLLQHEGDPALAGLAVDADHRLVAAAEISRIDREIGHFPDA